MSVVGGILVAPSTAEGLGSGSADAPLPGDAASIRIGGVEAIFEYRSLRLNVRSWWDTYIINRISGLDDADVRDSREQNPGYDGETPGNANYGGRTIVLSGYIRAYSLNKMRDMEKALRRAFADIGREDPLAIKIGDPDRDIVVFCKKVAKLDIPEEQTNFEHKRNFQITLRASDPRLHSYRRLLVQKFVQVEPVFSVANYGTYDAQAEFHFAGPITDLEMITAHSENWSRTFKLKSGTTIPAGETWVYNPAKNSFRRLSDGANRWQYIADDSEEIVLRPYDPVNQIEVQGTGMNASTLVSVFYRHAFL